MIIPYLTQINSPHFSKNNTGLGNALFQIFTAYGLSKKFNHNFNNHFLIDLINKLNSLDLNHSSTIFRNLKIYESIDNNTIILKKNYFSKIFRNLKNYKSIDNNSIILNEKENYYSLYDTFLIDNIKKINNDRIIVLKGYLQSHLYFDEYYNNIIKLISPDKNSLNIIKKNYNHLFDNNIINISLHFRLKWGENLQYNYNYYYNAIKYIEQNFRNKNTSKKKIILNIFGDDIEQIKLNFKSTQYQCIYFENNTDYIDLWCMSLCNCNVISHSTLSWWGGYININKDKIVIYSYDILRLVNATVYDKPMLTDRIFQHYKPDWIPLKTKNVIFQ